MKRGLVVNALEVNSTNVVETQAGENEKMQQGKGKLLVRERKLKEIDNVMNCKERISWLTKGSR